MEGALKILLLEDCSVDAEIIQRVLRKDNLLFELKIADSEKTFLDALDQFRPDVILADNSLPQFNAPEAMKTLNDRALHIPFILVTGTVSEEFAADIMKLGADDYILKDRLGRLPAAIEAALKQRQAEKEKADAQQKLTQSEERYRSLVERITDGFIALDSEWCYTYINKTAGEIIHMDPQPLIGKNVWEVFPAAVGSSTYNAFMKAMKEQRYIHNVDYYAPLDLWQENHIYPSPDGLSVFIRDITEKKRAELELQAAKDRLFFHIDNSPLGFIEWDEHWQVKSWSKRAEQIFGWTEPEMASFRQAAIYQIYKEDLPELTRGSDGMVMGEIQNYNEQHRNYRKDGRMIWCEWFNSVTKDRKGKITIMSLVLDVTERKLGENELKESNTQLHSLSSHLQDIREEERIHIAREIHDELGQQLTGLKMDMHWLSKRLETEDALVREKIGTIISLIDDTVKSVRRISSNLRPSILDDLGLIAALEWHGEEVAKRSEIKVVFTTDLQEPELPIAMATGIFRIYQEVLTNAVRHANAHEIVSSLKMHNENLVLDIKDDGIGMDQSLVKTRKTLGLVGIRERTFQLGGKIDLFSEPGKGTRICISVPFPGTT